MSSTIVDPCIDVCANVDPTFKAICMNLCDRYSNCPITPNALYNGIISLFKNVDTSKILPIEALFQGVLLRLLLFIFIPIVVFFIILGAMIAEGPGWIILYALIVILVFFGLGVWCVYSIQSYVSQSLSSSARSLENTISQNQETAALSYIEAIRKSKTPC